MCTDVLRSYGVVVSTRDFESRDPGSNPGRTSIFAYIFNLFLFAYQIRSEILNSLNLLRPKEKIN